NGALVGIERNNHGHAAIRSCTTEDTSVTPYARLYRAPDDKLGWHTTPQTRPVMWDEWHSWLRAARTSNAAERLMDATAAHEMRTLVLDDGKPQAATGAHDDVFTADAIAWQLRVRSSPPRRDEGGERYRSEADRAGSLV
ncbi:MAG: hypothetical protein EBW55_03785, partial [Betaproteobacteria bacterium]|nr:hypothetical protein [Betaproteobacteria bacterium]